MKNSSYQVQCLLEDLSSSRVQSRWTWSFPQSGCVTSSTPVWGIFLSVTLQGLFYVRLKEWRSSYFLMSYAVSSYLVANVSFPLFKVIFLFQARQTKWKTVVPKVLMNYQVTWRINTGMEHVACLSCKLFLCGWGSLRSARFKLFRVRKWHELYLAKIL